MTSIKFATKLLIQSALLQLVGSLNGTRLCIVWTRVQILDRVRFGGQANSGNHRISSWLLAPRTFYRSGPNCHLCVVATQLREHHASGAEGQSASWVRASSHFNGSWEPLTVHCTNLVLSMWGPRVVMIRTCGWC